MGSQPTIDVPSLCRLHCQIAAHMLEPDDAPLSASLIALECFHFALQADHVAVAAGYNPATCQLADVGRLASLFRQRPPCCLIAPATFDRIIEHARVGVYEGAAVRHQLRGAGL